MIGIVVSQADDASAHLGEHLLALREWTEREDDARAPADGGGSYHRSGPFELRTFEGLHVELEGVADAFDDVDLVVFASRHAGETGPLLTAHFTGNLGAAEVGGQDRALAQAAPAALPPVLGALDEHAPAGYDTGVECTHHGPSEVGAPSLFVELGSGPDEWADAAAAEAVARAILALEDVEDPWAERTVVGVGGGHYAKRFERLVRETGWTVGHVAAEWGLEALGNPRAHEDVVRQLFERSGTERALVDGDHPTVEAVIRELGFEVVSETWLRAVDGVGLTLAAALETDLSTVAEGLRFGDPAREHVTRSGAADSGSLDTGVSDGYRLVPLPDDLLGAARSVDRERTRTVVESILLAFETTEGASKVAGRAAVTDAGVLDEFVESLVAILRERYDSVTRDGETVVAVERGFDPALARDLGVPEGPMFGRLAEGEPVEVDGATVDPADVTAERRVTFPVPGPQEDATDP